MADVKELNINNTTYTIKDAVARSGLTGKQDTLVSGTNIKTINSQSILGSGDITIQGGGASRNIGEIVASTIPLTDAGLHLLDGALLQYGSYQAFIDYIAGLVNTYPDIFETEANWQTAVTTYGVCGKFVYDSVNNTVRLPKITGIIEGTTDATALGDLVEAGLPNISCPMYCVVGNADNHMASGGTTQEAVTWNASSFNSIYGNSSTVQPQTIKAFYYIVIANSTKTEIEVDIDEIATDLNGKADVDLTNINNNGTAKILHCALPSTTYDNLTVGASGTEYTAPADGWFFMVGGAASNSSCYATITNTTTDISQQNQLWGTYGNQRLLLYANKGEKMRLEYGNVSVFTLRFYYANGNAWEA